MSTSCSLEPVTVALFGKEVFVDGLIDLKMRAYWIIQPELKSNDRRHTEEKSQVKKGDCKEEKALAEKTGKSGRAFLCHIRELRLYTLSNSFRLYARKSSMVISAL